MMLSAWLVTFWLVMALSVEHVEKSHGLLEHPHHNLSLLNSGLTKAQNNSVILDSRVVWDDASNSTFYGLKMSETFVYNSKFRRIHNFNNSLSCTIVERNLNAFVARVFSGRPFSDHGIWRKLRFVLLQQYYNNNGVIVYNQRGKRWTFLASIIWKFRKLTKSSILSNRLGLSSTLFRRQGSSKKSQLRFEVCHVRISCALPLLGVLSIDRAPTEGEDYIPLTIIAQLISNTTLKSTSSERRQAKIESYRRVAPINSRRGLYSTSVREAVLINLAIVAEEPYLTSCKQIQCARFTRTIIFVDSNHIAY